MVSKAERKAARKAQAEQAAKTAPANTTPAAEKQQARRPGKVRVLKDNAQFRGARKAWYDVLLAHNGKPIADYEEHCTKNPPSLPKSGRAEAPSGWVRYFVRTGVLAIDQPSA